MFLAKPQYYLRENIIPSLFSLWTGVYNIALTWQLVKIAHNIRMQPNLNLWSFAGTFKSPLKSFQELKRIANNKLTRVNKTYPIKHKY